MHIRESHGITLIVLIVTIITLLILAGVTISTITGGESTIDKAKQSKNESEIQKEMEELQELINNSAAKGLKHGNFSGSADAQTIREALKNLVTDTSNIVGNGPWFVTSINTGIEYIIKKMVL